MTRPILRNSIGIAFLLYAFTTLLSAQQLTTLYSFVRGNDGAYPQFGALIQANDGNFYGTTDDGGENFDGTIFKITPSGTLTTLYSFTNSDGSPFGGLVQASDGNFYGTTADGGANNDGIIFKVTPSGTLTTLYSFAGSDGAEPYATVVQGSDGNFYGTTALGGAHNDGTIFKITPSGTLTTLYSFSGSDGANPFGGVVQGSDGNFHGTTGYGGDFTDCELGCGTVFAITPSGTLTTWYKFNGDGELPTSGLMQASDGHLYGTTFKGGANNKGLIYEATPYGAILVMHSFTGSDGTGPWAGLVQGNDGNFYGTTQSGGANNKGTVFKIFPFGNLTTLYSFAGTDGAQPSAGLVQGNDGNVYGTTQYGGTSNYGTVFTVSRQPSQFVAVTPCRLLDTRNTAPIQGGTFQNFILPQLARSNGCADLSTAGTYSLNVTLVPIDHQPVSYLTIWPVGGTQPVVSTMNSLDGRIKANAAIVPAGIAGGVSVFVTNTTNVVLDIDGYFAPVTQSTLAFYPLTPCRVVDTRNTDGPLGGPYLKTNEERDFPVLSSSCNIPDTAQAYSMNFTVVPYQGQPLGYLTAWPQGGSQPLVSTLNNLTATLVANAAIVPAGTGGGIATYPSGNTDLVIDIDGYFAAPGQGGLSLYPLTPCRVFDSRKVNGAFSGLLNPPVNFPNSECGVPTVAQGYVTNATVVPSPSLAYLTLWPDGQDQPLVSTLNASDGWITSNMAIVPTNNGSIDAYAAGRTQLILDISSYFAP